MSMEIEPGDNAEVKRVKMTFDMFIRTAAVRKKDGYNDHALLMHYQLFCICEAMNTFNSVQTPSSLADLFREIDSASRSLNEMQSK